MYHNLLRPRNLIWLLFIHFHTKDRPISIHCDIILQKCHSPCSGYLRHLCSFSHFLVKPLFPGRFLIFDFTSKTPIFVVVFFFILIHTLLNTISQTSSLRWIYRWIMVSWKTYKCSSDFWLFFFTWKKPLSQRNDAFESFIAHFQIL